MPLDDDSTGPLAKRKRPMISCRECHRRKQKCNRRQPCAHCIRRGKIEACRYDLDDDDHHVRSAFVPIELELGDHPANGIPETQPFSDDTLSASEVGGDEFRLLGYANNIKATPGVIRGLGESPSVLHECSPSHQSAASQYANIIRELPSRRHIHMLVQDFFKNVAWHYDIVDEDTFNSQLSQWSCLSFRQLKNAPHSLPASLRSFPALLFQVLAQCLLFQPIQHDESLEDLKYAPDMELSDLAAEMSEAGHRLASSFTKSQTTLMVVQAELLRACFEKTTGAVIEAWHTLGGAIRDAQELGLHEMGPEPAPSLRLRRGISTDYELGRKMWFNLHLWDAHMAVVLGRPISTKMDSADVPLPMSRSADLGVSNPPQPRDVILCGYHTAYKYLQKIHDIENCDDASFQVESIHASILTNLANLPAWATIQSSRRDDEPRWLSAALETMVTNVHFVLFALHRPFVFANASSRHRGFQAAMQILESQARLFDHTEPLQYKAFSLVFATFDAMVLVAAMHIRFSSEFQDQISATRRNLEWGLNRLDTLQSTNQLASIAFNVVQRLYQKMMATFVPMHTLRSSLQGGVGDDDQAGMGNNTTELDWESILQLDMGDTLSAHPLSELLYSGSFDTGSTG